MSPSQPLSSNPITPTPSEERTREEWIAFAERCIDEFLDLVADRTLYGYGLLSDAVRVVRYERQLAEIAGHIGQAEVDAAYDRVEARWREKLGERLWAAVLSDRPALADDMFRDEDSATGERGRCPVHPCAACGEDVSPGDEVSTFCGGVHAACLGRHLTECGVCRSHPPAA